MSATTARKKRKSTELVQPDEQQQCPFTEREFSSNNGFQVAVWGPSAWHLLHTKSFNYPVHPTEDQKQFYRTDVENMQNTLPCGTCRTNLIENMRKLPLLDKHLRSRAAFSKYVYDLHETVNEMLGKPSGLSYEQVRARYENFRARCNKTQKKKKERKHQKHKEHGGCTEPQYEGTGAKCLLRIVPDKSKEKTFDLDKRCVKRLKSRELRSL